MADWQNEELQNLTCINYTDILVDDLTNTYRIQALFGSIYGIIFLTGVSANSGVILLFFLLPAMRTPSHVLLLNLMLADMMLCFTSIPMTPHTVFTKQWHFGHIACKSMAFTQGISFLVMSWTLCAISLDRCLHIISPTRLRMSMKLAGSITIGIWLSGVCVNLPITFAMTEVDGSTQILPLGNISHTLCGKYCIEHFPGSDGLFRKLFGSALLCLLFIIPFLVIAYSYIRIFSKVRSDLITSSGRATETLGQLSATELGSKRARKMRAKVFAISISMVMTFFFCWLPQTIFNSLRDFDALPEVFYPQIWLIKLVVHSLAMSIVFWNPVLFFWLTWRYDRLMDIVRKQSSFLSFKGTPLLSHHSRRSDKAKENHAGYKHDTLATRRYTVSFGVHDSHVNMRQYKQRMSVQTTSDDTNLLYVPALASPLFLTQDHSPILSPLISRI